jgi:hypothetical protein
MKVVSVANGSWARESAEARGEDASETEILTLGRKVPTIAGYPWNYSN